MSQDIYILQQQKKLPEFNILGANGFIWLPLKDVPIDEHYPIDSMHQPALKMFDLLTWTAIAPFATDNQKFMRELALGHKEMGYFLIHHRNIFGIIGVTEYGDDHMPGRAVIFNATRAGSRNASKPTMLKLVYSELKYPCKTFVYAPGKISNYTRISEESWAGPWGDD